MNPDGHRLWYVRLVVDAANEQNRLPVLFTSAEARASDEYRVHLSSVSVDVRVLQEVDWRALVSAARTADSMLISLDADKQLASLMLAARLNHRNPQGRPLVTALLMRPLKQPGARGLVVLAGKMALAAVARVGLSSVRCVALASDGGRSGLMSMLRLVEPVLDPVAVAPWSGGRDEWLINHGIPLNQPLAVIMGEVSARKFAPEVVRAFGSLPPEVELNLALVGRLDEETAIAVESLPAESRRKLFLVTGYLPDDAFDSWIAYADAVVVMHRNAGASGVLLKAGLVRTPVLVGGERSVVSAAYAIGGPMTLTSPSIQDIARALSDIRIGAPRVAGPLQDLRGFPAVFLRC